MEKISVLGNNRRTDRRGTVSLESPLPFSPLTYLTPQNSFGTRSHSTALTLSVLQREIWIHVRLPISKLEGTAADAAPMLFLANHFHKRIGERIRQAGHRLWRADRVLLSCIIKRFNAPSPHNGFRAVRASGPSVEIDFTSLAC